MKSLLRFFVFRFLLRTIWIGLLATFGIQLLLTFLPPKRVIDTESTSGNQRMIVRQWKTANYVDWLGNLLKGNLQVTDNPSGNWLAREIRVRSSNTLTLCWNAFLIAALMGIFAGTTKATLNSEHVSGPKKALSTILSSASTTILFVLSSVPAYIIAYFLFLLLKSQSNMFLAVIALAMGSGLAMDVARLTTNIHQRELYSKYVENALTCGLKTSGFIPVPGSVGWHAFRNSLITVLPITAYRLPLIVSSALVVEVVFDLPGLGESLLSALIQQDTPMILTIILISVLFVQVCVFLADVLAYALHPQRYSG